MARIQITGEIRERFVNSMLAELAVASGMQLVAIAESDLWARTKAAVPDPLWVEEENLNGGEFGREGDGWEQLVQLAQLVEPVGWQNGLAEAVARMREHLTNKVPIKFDARDRLALAYILDRAGK